LDELLTRMAELGASDLYLKTTSPPAYRVAGRISFAEAPPLTEAETADLAEQVMTPRARGLFDRNQQVDCSYSVPEVGRFRCNVYQQRGSIGMVFRLVSTEIPTLDELGLPEALRELAMEPRGLVLITGATGSGKSTTLAAMIDWRNRNSSGHIVTIEDPIEFLHPDHQCVVSQREVGLDVASYTAALGATLRQAPDVLLLGEIRNVDSAEAALHLAETGHLVLGTLHSTNANQTVERLLQFFPGDRHHEIFSQLAGNLRGVISQRLLVGRNGRLKLAAEVMLATPRIQDLLRAASVDKLKQCIEQGDREGMQTFDQAVHALWLAEEIDEETALAAADSPNDLKLKMRGFVAVGR